MSEQKLTPQEVFRDFVRTQVLGKERSLDALGEPPTEAYRTFFDLGYANWWLPQHLGGHGISLEQSVDLVAELAYGDAGLAFALFLSILSTSMVQLCGTPEQQEKFLRPLAGHGRFSALAGSEQQAGSELLNTATVAKPADGGYSITGRKFFSTNAAFAEFVVVTARIDSSSTPDFKAFIVERGSPGMRVLRRWETAGLRAAATYELEFADCFVPASSVLSGNGLRVLELGLNASRILIAATAIGVGRRLQDICLAYAKTKQLKGASLSTSPIFGAKLGQVEMQLEAIRSVCQTAAREYDQQLRSDRTPEQLLRIGMLKSATVAKMYAGQAGWMIATMASEALGGLGYTTDSLVEKLVRDMRYISIVEAGDDVLRELLYQRYVLPRGRKLG